MNFRRRRTTLPGARPRGGPAPSTRIRLFTRTKTAYSIDGQALVEGLGSTEPGTRALAEDVLHELARASDKTVAGAFQLSIRSQMLAAEEAICHVAKAELVNAGLKPAVASPKHPPG